MNSTENAMSFMDAVNYWSALHLAGSFILTVTLGSLNIAVGPTMSGGVILSLGIGWEVIVDQELKLNDARGGDYYDVCWDLAGCALGTAFLKATEDYRKSLYAQRPSFVLQEIHMPEESSGSEGSYMGLERAFPAQIRPSKTWELRILFQTSPSWMGYSPRLSMLHLSYKPDWSLLMTPEARYFQPEK